MKAIASPTTASQITEVSRLADLLELVKVRLSGLVLVTMLCGFYLGTRGDLNVPGVVHVLIGTAMLAFGASALNQFQERNLDARMRRTANRPLPAGRMLPETARVIGLTLAVSGVVYLAVLVNLLTSSIGAVTLLIYNLIYTPLKRITWLNTMVGAVPGALPPVMGWTAARGELSFEGWLLFAVLFFWQIPHFLAIAWLYRDDYERAGFVMLPQIDADGTRTGRQALWHAAGLTVVSIVPVGAGLAGAVYLAAALGLGALILRASWRFQRELTAQAARGLFLASIAYLPLLLGVMALNKLNA